MHADAMHLRLTWSLTGGAVLPSYWPHLGLKVVRDYFPCLPRDRKKGRFDAVRLNGFYSRMDIFSVPSYSQN